MTQTPIVLPLREQIESAAQRMLGASATATIIRGAPRGPNARMLALLGAMLPKVGTGAVGKGVESHAVTPLGAATPKTPAKSENLDPKTFAEAVRSVKEVAKATGEACTHSQAIKLAIDLFPALYQTYRKTGGPL